MAKVKTEKTYYNVGNKSREFVKVVKVDPGSGVFSVRLPAEAGMILGKDEVVGKTLQAVEDAYNEAMKEYNSGAVESSQVILYEFDYHASKKDPSHITHGINSGLMIQIYAAVFLEHKATAKSGEVTYRYELIDSSLEYPPHDFMYQNYRSRPYERRLAWTQDLEAFFKNTQTAMESIIKKLEEISQPAKLIEYAGAGLLLGGPGEKERE